MNAMQLQNGSCFASNVVLMTNTFKHTYVFSNKGSSYHIVMVDIVCIVIISSMFVQLLILLPFGNYLFLL